MEITASAELSASAESSAFTAFAGSGLQRWVLDEPFALESGAALPRLEIGYHAYGTPNAARDNVVWICHALTGNSDAASWWDGLVGAGRLFDPARYYVVCANMLGSCYGSSGALSLNPATGEPFYGDFPQITVRDMARAHAALRRRLGVERIFACVGGSMGGQQALEWAILEPERFDAIVPMATNARHSPWGVAFNAAQRLAIEADPTFGERSSRAGAAGLKAARSIGMLSYRNYETFLRAQSEDDLEDNDKTDSFRAESYQAHQGDKLVRRFNARSYWQLSKAMDSHNVGRGRGSAAQALRRIQAKALVVGISTDMLFPTEEQKFLARHIPNALYTEISSAYGHDGFLIEFEAIGERLEAFFAQTRGERDAKSARMESSAA